MLSLFNPKTRLLNKSLNQYLDIVSTINELLDQPYSYTRFCIKRQLELELLDLSTVIYHCTPNHVVRYSNYTLYTENIPITLLPRYSRPSIDIADKNFTDTLTYYLSRLKLHRTLPLTNSESAQLQQHIFDNLFPLFAGYPFMTISIFWKILNNIYSSLDIPLRLYLPNKYNKKESLVTSFPINLQPNQGNIYDHLY